MADIEITFMTEPREMELDGAQISINGLSYVRVPGRGVRFNFGEMHVSTLGHMWFWRAHDLRGMILRVLYSGNSPTLINFFISRSTYGERYIYTVRLEKTEEGRTFDLYVPDEPAFKETAIFGFYFERRGAGNRTGEFFVEKVEVIKALEDHAPPKYRRVKQ